MDIATILGLIIAVVALFTGMILKGVPPEALANPAAILIIIAGTVGAVTIATPGGNLKNLPKLFGIAFGKPKYMTAEAAINFITGLAETVRKEGILSLDNQVSSFEDRFVKNGLQLLIDGSDVQYIENTLEEEIAAMEARHAANAQVFTQAGTYAPTLGVLGAVVGLIAALTDLSDIDKLGHAISAAFVATLLGIFTGYVLWHPLANKLKQKSKQEVAIKSLLLTGIIGIGEGKNPRTLRDRLLIQLSETEQKKMGAEG